MLRRGPGKGLGDWVRQPTDAANHATHMLFSFSFSRFHRILHLGRHAILHQPATCILGATATAVVLRWWAPKSLLGRLVGGAAAASPPILLAVLGGRPGSRPRLASATLAGLTALSAFTLVALAPGRGPQHLEAEEAIESEGATEAEGATEGKAAEAVSVEGGCISAPTTPTPPATVETDKDAGAAEPGSLLLV